MTLKEIKEKKEQAQKEIETIIAKFSNETLVEVSKIDLAKLKINNNLSVCIKITCSLSI